MVAAMTPWIRKASRTLPSPMVLSAINATVAVSVPLSIYMVVNAITFSIQPFVRACLGPCQGKH